MDTVTSQSYCDLRLLSIRIEFSSNDFIQTKANDNDDSIHSKATQNFEFGSQTQIN